MNPGVVPAVPPAEPSAARARPDRALARFRSPLAALGAGLAMGALVGGYVHAWWGAGLFVTSSVLSAAALLAIAIVVIVALVVAVTSDSGHPRRAQTSVTLAVALVGGTIAGAALGPAYRPAATFPGEIEIHVVTPTAVDWRWDVSCATRENSSDVGYIGAGTWSHGGASMDSLTLGFHESGTPYFRFGSETNLYDSSWSGAAIEVRELAAERLSGEVAFTGLEPRGPGYLPAFPGHALEGTLAWTCDPTRPPRTGGGSG